MSPKLIQAAITVSAIGLIIAHAIWPEWKIDGVTVGLLIVAIIPWLAPLLKTLELPGGWKIEFRDLQRAKEKANQAGLLSPSSAIDRSEVYPFELVAEGDPNLALAGLRIEIEKRLQQLAQLQGIDTKRSSVGNLLTALSRTEALNHEERGVLADMLNLLNSAVHGASVDQRAANWAIEVGPLLLKTLDERITEIQKWN